MLLPVLPRGQSSHRYNPRIRHHDAAQDFYRCGLARAVGSDVPDQFPLLHVKRDVLQGLHPFLLPQQGAFLPFLADVKMLAEPLY